MAERFVFRTIKINPEADRRRAMFLHTNRKLSGRPAPRGPDTSSEPKDPNSTA